MGIHDNLLESLIVLSGNHTIDARSDAVILQPFDSLPGQGEVIVRTPCFQGIVNTVKTDINLTEDMALSRYFFRDEMAV